MFHISIFELWHSRDNNLKSQSILIDNKEKSKINEMRDKKMGNNIFNYLINWKNFHFYKDL